MTEPKDQLDHYLRRWNLSHPEPLAQTPTSHVYTVQQQGERVVLKLLTPVGIQDEYGGAIALRHFNGHGAIRLLDHDAGAHLLEYAGDEELAPMVWRGDDLEAARIIAGVLNKLHRAKWDPVFAQLQTLRRRFRSLFRKAAEDEAAGVTSIYVRGAQVAERLLANPQDECVLHGDIHHQNVRWHPARGWLAFDPKGIYGERTYDAANTLCNPPQASALVRSEDRLLAVSQALAGGMGVPVGRLRAFVFAYACLSAVWWREDIPDADDEVIEETLIVARNAGKHADLST